MVTHNTKDAPNLILTIIKFHSSFFYNCDCLLCLSLLCLIVDQNMRAFLLCMTTATHCKGLQHAGTIFICSGLTGNDEACILAFGISGGNEDNRTWNTFNTLFATACPSEPFVEDGHSYSKFVFVSNRDKGLDKSLSVIFPRNHATNCVHHIKQNVKTQFGLNAAEMVFPIANAFLTIQEKTLLEQRKTKSASAYDHLEKIPMEQWHNMQWITTWKLPPQH